MAYQPGPIDRRKQRIAARLGVSRARTDPTYRRLVQTLDQQQERMGQGLRDLIARIEEQQARPDLDAQLAEVFGDGE
jgi:hypothetical protein